MLSNPLLSSSGGSSAVASISSASRSRMALAYSARFRRWSAVRPGRGLGGGCAIDCALEVADESFERRGVRARHASRRHHAGAHLPDHLLPGLGGLRNVRQIRVLERQLAGLRAVVMTRDAVRLERRSVAGGRGSLRCSRTLRRTSRSGQNDGKDKRSGGEAQGRAGSDARRDPVTNSQIDPNSIGSYSLAEIRRRSLLRRARPQKAPDDVAGGALDAERDLAAVSERQSQGVRAG